MNHEINRRNFLETSLITAVMASTSVRSRTLGAAENDNAVESPFSVDFSQKTTPLKPVNGSNFWARLSNNRIFDAHELVKKLNISTVRLHDIPLQNPGMRLVDIPMIFGRFDADTNDPKNYYFAATDDYIARILDGKAKIIYRLGPSIEHTQPRRYFALEPSDYLQFAKICEGIIRHYNEGWADGFHHNIEHWEIWNEPDLNPQMWDKDFGTYCKMYATVSKYLKEKFSNLKIGGPALCHVSLAETFLKACQDAKAPLDFISWHSYASQPDHVIQMTFQVDALLKKYGYPNAEQHLNEWHYFPC
ncbi:MAG: hypothetical protein Q4C70_03290, partial [Planctomycetia bacterium]|nr:hypothetical protein [Planctomycetia bacterium]